MSSNEDYLDSLLKSVIDKEKDDLEIDFSDVLSQMDEPEDAGARESFQEEAVSEIMQEDEPEVSEEEELWFQEEPETTQDKVDGEIEQDVSEEIEPEDNWKLEEFSANSEFDQQIEEPVADSGQGEWEPEGEAEDTEADWEADWQFESAETPSADAQAEGKADSVDVMDLLDSFADDEDLAEINELLKKNDDNVMVEDDMLDLLKDFPEEAIEDAADENMGLPIGDFDFFAEENSASEEKEVGVDEMEALLKEKNGEEAGIEEPKKGKVKREKKEKKKSETGIEGEIKPRGKLASLFHLLLKEDIDEETDEFAEGLKPSEENSDILKELDKEKKKKGKKAKKEKGEKKGSEAEAEGEDSDGKKAAGKRPKKEKKPKKGKAAVQEVSGKAENEKSISRKKIMHVTAFGITILAALLFVTIMIPSVLETLQAKKSFYQKDYMATYTMLYGKKLSNGNELIWNKVDTILKLSRKYEAYENFKNMGKDLEALDALIQGVSRYDTMTAAAEEYGVTQEFSDIYAKILAALSSEYGLAEADAREINAYVDDYTYTKRLKSIVSGTEFTEPEGTVPQPEELEDMLPEEEQYQENENAEGQGNEEAMTLPADETNGDGEAVSGNETSREVEIIDATIHVEQ